MLAAATPGLLVTPAELAAALKDPSVVVLTIANAPADFEAGHVPGARFIRYGDIAPTNRLCARSCRRWPVCARSSPRPVSPAPREIFIYGSPMPASRLFFTLDYLGYTQVKMLNGGLNAWKASGGATETGPQIRHRLDTDNLQALQPQPQRVVNADWIKRSVGDAARSRCSMHGPMPSSPAPMAAWACTSPGHLPGAQQLVWNTLFDGTGKFLPDAELRKKFDAIGASTETPLVSYCMVGMRASVTYFVARHLGYDARMYDGSIEDWTNKKLPAKTGR